MHFYSVLLIVSQAVFLQSVDYFQCLGGSGLYINPFPCDPGICRGLVSSDTSNYCTEADVVFVSSPCPAQPGLRSPCLLVWDTSILLAWLTGL